MTRLKRVAMGPTANIGIDVDDRCIRAAQATQPRGDARPGLPNWLVIRRHTRGSLTPAEARVLTQSLQRAGFRGKDLVMTARHEAVLSAVLELPPRSARVPVEQLARMEMARIHRKDAKDFVLGLWETPAPDRAKREGSMYAFVCAMGAQASDEHVAPFDATGYQVVSVLPRVCALSRACEPIVSGRAGLFGVVAAGWGSAHIALLHVDVDGTVVPVYERVIEEIGLGRLASAFAERTGLGEQGLLLALAGGDETVNQRPGVKELFAVARGPQSEYIEALVVEVQRSFGYAVPLHPSLTFQGVLVLGEGAGTQGLCDRMSVATGVEVRAVRAEQLLAGDHAGLDPGIEYAIGASRCGRAGAEGGAMEGRAA